MKILVAEDDAVTRKILAVTLERLGWDAADWPRSVFFASKVTRFLPHATPVQGLMQAKRTPPVDAVVLDINMPGGGAVEATRASGVVRSIDEGALTPGVP